MGYHTKQRSDPLARFDHLQREIAGAKENMESAARGLCEAISVSNGALSSALQCKKEDPQEKGFWKVVFKRFS